MGVETTEIAQHEIEDTANKIRQFASGLFVEREEMMVVGEDPTFGMDGNSSSKLFYLIQPDNNFSGFQSLRLPGPLRSAVRASQSSEKMMHEAAYIFHYPVNVDRFRSTAEKVSETERFFDKDFDAQAFVSWFEQKFKKPSVIYTSINSLSAFVGDEALMFQAMRIIKRNPESAEELLKKLFGAHGSSVANSLDNYRKQPRPSLNIYDVINAPREVHFTL